MESTSQLIDYPYNLLIATRGPKILELPASLTKDIQAGIAYALFMLEEEERSVLEQKFRLGIALDGDQQQTERIALKKLRHPSRWNYICYGIIGYGKMRAVEAGRKGFIQGYHDGYAAGLKAESTGKEELESLDIMDLPIETMPVSTRVCNALCRNECRLVRDVVSLDIETIRRIRNLGEKGIQEVLRALHSYGLTHTHWELY